MNAFNVKVWINNGKFFISVPADFPQRLVDDIARQAMKTFHGVPLSPSLSRYAYSAEGMGSVTYIDSRDYHDRINPDDYPYK